MSFETVTTAGNKQISERLKGMLVDLRNSTATYFEQIENIRNQAYCEGLEDHEINLLIKNYLKEFRNRNQIKYILYDKARRAKQNSLTKNLGTSPQHDNIPSIPAPDYKIVVPDQVIEEEQEQLTKQQQEYKPEYALEDLRSQVESYKSQIEELTADKKNIEEKYKQLEAKTSVSPAVQVSNLRTKVVVAQIFREVLALKGSKMIYASILIDLAQNKYVRLEPV
jgi:DNA polymerase III alpha subunit (gram-positive type)